MNCRYDVLCCRRTIIVGEGDERTVFITYAEDIATFQRFAEALIAGDRTSLVQDAVGGALLPGMRVYEYKPVAFTHDLGMKSGDDRLLDDNIVGGVTANIGYLRGKRIVWPILVDVGAYL